MTDPAADPLTSTPASRKGGSGSPSAPGSDAPLISRCLTGDQRAWAELIERYQRLVYSIPRKYRLNEDVCDDVFQSVFAVLLRELPRLRDQATLAKWLITTTTRECWRQAKRARRASSSAQPASEPWAGDGSLPQDQVLSWERRHRVQEALSELGGQCEELLRALFFTQGKPGYTEIARRLGIPVGSIGPVRGRCLKKLLEFLPDFGEEQGSE